MRRLRLAFAARRRDTHDTRFEEDNAMEGTSRPQVPAPAPAGDTERLLLMVAAIGGLPAIAGGVTILGLLMYLLRG
jgi:hypothetical protein